MLSKMYFPVYTKVSGSAMQKTWGLPELGNGCDVAESHHAGPLMHSGCSCGTDLPATQLPL